ncbi:MAG TPA: hypothetical protein GX510_10465 [Firmicutes bacterium]|nr:hypothetical protein [Candidatus Fermentithermobacillaceae bacterium]
MWRYDDFLTVSEDFVPVFSEDVDRNYRGNWKFFIPHEHMRNLMEKLILALERTHVANKRSIWLTGAYGTGKTFASFVIKHLLEDPVDEIENYFQKHQVLSSLWPRFLALRARGPYLVVYRSGSGHITSSRRLMIEVQQAIKDQLKMHGYLSAFGAGITDQLIDKLSDTTGVFNWERILNKYRGRFQTFRTLSTVDEVTERLRNGDLKLAEEVASALEEEGLTLVDSPAAVKNWIREAIASNNLQGIVFIWDEFTEFLTNNVGVTTLQELAQATADMPFYLFLITHRALNQFTRIDDDTRKKLADRFHNCQLEMSPVTAYKLIANTIEINPGRQSEWEAKRDTLWSKVDVAVLHINVLGERVEKQELKMLTPIHPLTAYLLATISGLYSSSQRSLFIFLKTNEPGSFRWFTANYPKDDWYWLTPDYLWQYFFEDIRIETVESISDILSYYHTSKTQLKNEEEARVFRVMLLLTALWRQTQGAHPLLKPSLSVIKRMFVGTVLYNHVGEVADDLCARGVMLSVPSGSDCEYIVPTATVDHTKLQEYKQKAETSLTFEKMISVERPDAEIAPQLKELFWLQGAAMLRHPLRIVSARDLKLGGDRIIRGVERPYEIGVIFVTAQEDEHLNSSEQVAIELSKQCPNYCILISQIPFGERRWREWIDCRARALYHEEMRDSTPKRYYDVRSQNITKEWIDSIRTGRIRAFFRGKQEELFGFDAVASYLEEIVSAVYPCGPEKLSKIATLYTATWGKAGAEIGLGIARNVQRPYKDLVDQLRVQGVWENEGLNVPGDHPLTKMKNLVDEFFTSHEHVRLASLWEALQQPPYGLMPSPIGILLFALLLRSYSNGYYYSDGANSLPLNPNKLAELIDQVMKGTKPSENYTIRRMSDAAEGFCHMARDVFRMGDEQTKYPEEARKNMRRNILDLGYPVWAVVYFAQETEEEGLVSDLRRATEKLSDVLAYDQNELSDLEMKETVEAVNPVRHELAKLISRDRMQEGMKLFWRTHAPQLLPLMQSLNLGVPEVMRRLHNLLNEDVYLWREHRVIEKLPEVVRELDLTDALNRLCGASKQNLDDLRDHFRNNWFKSKLPLIFYRERQRDELSDLIDYLHRLIYRPGQGPIDNRADDIRRLSDELVSLLGKTTFVTRILVEKFTGQRLNDQDAAQLYDSLPDLSDASQEEIRRAILDVLSRQVKQKKLAELHELWRTITGSESPQCWSEEMRVPIQWLMEGDGHRKFFVRYADADRLSEGEIDEMIAYLRDHAQEFAILKNVELVQDKFIQAAAGDYAEIVRQSGGAEVLRDRIYRTMHGNVYDWPARLNEVNRVVRQWVMDNYRAMTYPRILQIIDKMSPEETKRFLRNLVAEDALVGARLLAAVEWEDKQRHEKG